MNMTTSGKRAELRDRAHRAVASGRGGGRLRGNWVGGGVVLAGILLMLAWSVWVGLIVVLVGLVAFGGFVKGKWY